MTPLEVEYYNGTPISEVSALLTIAVKAVDLSIQIRELADESGHPALRSPFRGVAVRLRTLPGLISKFSPSLRDDIALLEALLEKEKGRYEKERIVGMDVNEDRLLEIYLMNKELSTIIRSPLNENKDRGTDNRKPDSELDEGRGGRGGDRGLGGQPSESWAASTDSDRQKEKADSRDEKSDGGEDKPFSWLSRVQ